MKLDYFKTVDFHTALRTFFKNLNVPVNYIAEEPTRPQAILSGTYKKDHPAFQLMKDVYFLGMVDNAAFEGSAGLAPEKIESDYDGILIFGVTLNPRDNGMLPTRSQLAEIARAFNREYFYTPVIVVYKYGKHLAFANTQRLKYKHEWREGEKAGKVSLLRDIDITNPHAGHLRILKDLIIPDSGKNKVDSFAKLYTYWQDVFSVNILNKKFYQELSNWYFWAIKEVAFPDSPVSLIHKLDEKQKALKHEHNAKNVIRLLTRFLFVWFVKEKKLIPEELLDINYLKNELLKDISPVRDEGLFKGANIESVYYKAILQNLFFASLNCPIESSENGDNRKRGFRLKDNFGQHRDANYLMRYKDQFKNPENFLKLINEVVPFLNGGLFECLDNKTDKIYIDGFSDNLVKPHQLIVPDYLFFGFDQEVDLSGVVGINTNAYKKAGVKGLIHILESYKFTIAENTPIEEDVALDPELLGKVFENLLASYNPETKTTARKQTGSFYTPREIVNYMVDESLIAYLKNSVKNLGIEDEKLDIQLHELLSYDDINPFSENKDLQKQIIHALDNCKILDPACGSGAFPMGILQKMVHVLQKVDPENKYWQELQLNKAVKETEGAFVLTDKKEREQKLIEINEAFDEKINDPDYARKLFLVEDCIYGVDIQPIATQISKLRFFISLVVDQKVDKDKPNFGIRALPNLETKFVAANTLIGIDKPEAQMTLFDNKEIKELEQELKNVRHRLFSAKSPVTKRRLRDKDKEIREKIGTLLIEHGWGNETAKQLAGWDPYDQNASSPFFDPEWMFDISDGFDVVIGNPPYVKEHTDKSVFNGLRHSKYYQGKMDLWYFFACVCIDMLKSTPNGCLCFIATNNWITNSGASKLRNKILSDTKIVQFIDFADFKIFESAGIQTMVFVLEKEKDVIKHEVKYSKLDDSQIKFNELEKFLNREKDNRFLSYKSIIQPDKFIDKTINFTSNYVLKILSLIDSGRNFNLQPYEINSGIDIPQDFVNRYSLSVLGSKAYIGDGIFVLSGDEIESLNLNATELDLIKPFFTTSELYRYSVNPKNKYWIIYTDSSFKNPNSMSRYPNLKRHLDRFQSVITSENKPYGLNRARDQKFFKGEKIIVQRKCPKKQSFVYVNFDSYLNRTFLPIKTNRISCKYLTAIFNSKLSAYWLKYKGKMQGDNFQIDKEPVLTIPIRLDSTFAVLETLVSIAIESSETLKIEEIVDSLIFELYFPDHMKDRNIDILQFVEKDLEEVMKGRDFDQLTDAQKEKTINRLHARWTDPESEVVKRMNSFTEKSPDILKPILESR